MPFASYLGSSEDLRPHTGCRIKLQTLPFGFVALCLFLAVLLCDGLAQTTSSAGSGQTASTLEGVLNQMDAAAAQFRSAQADFTWDQYTRVVNETETQKGKMYFRRVGKGETQMAANFEQPDQKYVIFADGKLRVYQPKIGQINEFDAGKNRAEFESFLVLGFGGRGHDLPQQFEVKFDGDEVVDGVKTAKLELSPKSDRVKNMINKFVIWVDAPRGVSLKQQAFEPSGDYRTAHYTDIKLNTKVPDDVFKLHVSGKTKTVKGG
jgi:outer membrane lipoprotein-sorting protein